MTSTFVIRLLCINGVIFLCSSIASAQSPAKVIEKRLAQNDEEDPVLPEDAPENEAGDDYDDEGEAGIEAGGAVEEVNEQDEGEEEEAPVKAPEEPPGREVPAETKKPTRTAPTQPNRPERANPPRETPSRPTPPSRSSLPPKASLGKDKKGVPTATVTVGKPDEDKVGADLVPDGQELVNIDFPEPTDIKDIIRAVSLWTGKNVILGRDVNGKVQMISPRKVTKVEAYQAFLSALNLLGFTTVETGKVIKIIPVRSAVKSNLKTFLGASWTPMTDELITQIVPLKYINAKEIQTNLSRIVSSNSMIAYQPTNTLIISDSGYKVRRILDIIELLDVKTQQPELSIVPIKYGDAKAIATMAQDIFKAQTTKGKGKSKSSYLTYKIMTDERTNSVVIFGPPRTIADVKALVRQFDVRVDDPARQATIHVRPLDYADAKKLATTLTALASGGKNNNRSSRRAPVSRSSRKKSSNTSSPPPVATLDNDVKITADEASNSLLVTGSRTAYDAINSIIRKLDIRRSQVFVEAEILDINVDGGFRFGTSIFAGSGKEDGTKVAYTWEAEQLSPLIVSQATGGNDTATKAGAAGVFANDLNIGILTGYKVNVPGIGEISPGALIKMVKTDSYTRVLSSPHILTANNEVAKISVGNKLFYRTNEVSTSGTAVENVKSEDVDLSLEIKPNISHSNYVTMKIDLDSNSGQIDAERRVPSVAKRKTSQIVTVKNGQTVVISGLVQTTEFESYQKIPLLGDIPILGWLFRNSTISKKKSNLMIFLTPHIIHGANDLAAIYEQKVEERDEILEKVYGAKFKDDDFYKALPRKEDGVYQADAFDVIDERKRKKRHNELMRDMGYESHEIEQIDRGNAEDAPSESSEDPVEPESVMTLPESFDNRAGTDSEAAEAKG